MELYIDKIGMIKDSLIDLGDLTVIAGENDTGKSTVGKTIYSILVALKNYENEYKSYFIRTLSDIYRIISKKLRSKNIEYDDLKIDRNLLIHAKVSSSSFKINLNILIKQLELTQENNSDVNLNDQITQLKELLDAENKLSKGDLLKLSVANRLKKEFGDDLCMKSTKDSSSIIVKDDYGSLDIRVKKEEIQDIKWDNFEVDFDAVYIETPFIVGIEESSSLPSRSNDLIKKIRNTEGIYYTEYQNTIDQILFDNKDLLDLDLISKLIKGNLEYDTHENKFIFRKKNKTKFQASNIASGIKVFGILDLLIKNGSLQKGSMLIIDEPEVHLHPEWQIEYAKVLLTLSQMGVKVLLATHSPYIVQALRYYGEGGGKTKFYTTEKNTLNTSKIIDCTDNLNLIFEKLADPFEKMIWERV